jgi:3-methyladenine DNA glycosylase AlkD
MGSGLRQSLRIALTAAADPARAPTMQAYMKSAMPYLGVTTVPRRAICKAVFAGLHWPDSAAWQADVLAIWRGAEFREERYCAIDLCGVKAARPFQHVAALPLYEEMIVTGAWWDHVDAIAGVRLWDILRHDGAAMKRVMRAWSHDADLWKRRSAILCQLHGGAATDPDLLYDCIEPSLDSREFFLRKAIGWALRQYARTDPRAVQAYVAAHHGRLSALSRREALKHVGPGA